MIGALCKRRYNEKKKCNVSSSETTKQETYSFNHSQLKLNIPRVVEYWYWIGWCMLVTRFVYSNSKCPIHYSMVKNEKAKKKNKTKTVKIYEAIIPKVILVSLLVILNRSLYTYTLRSAFFFKFIIPVRRRAGAFFKRQLLFRISFFKITSVCTTFGKAPFQHRFITQIYLDDCYGICHVNIYKFLPL